MPQPLQDLPWRALDREALEFHFNPRVSVPDFARYDQERTGLNEAALAECSPWLDIPYGDHPLHSLDIYPAQPGAGGEEGAVHVFFHGGYWRALDKANFAFIGGALAERGITTVIPNYELCPASTLDEVVASARAAFAWICANIHRYGASRDKISLSGHSAGAHLSAAILSADWNGDPSIPSALTGVLLVSGVFDPSPAMMTSLNDDLRLSREMADRNNMENCTPRLKAPVTLVAGALEPAHWQDMTVRYAEQLRRAGYAQVDMHMLPGCHHFNILDGYLDEHGIMRKAIPGAAGDPS
ncbi:alpha/beta hydrolase [Paracandidimonas soli]|uniref:Arylformamidase n=1 Tax=Paracandidimonas soli TaxID=1917182 RepID=A0A4R3VH73_9BURK|nr:alpha/beta hydrolase [Paracandidimonas soli]TCV03108.1 arylformamidase [Paracandidimonas soli]